MAAGHGCVFRPTRCVTHCAHPSQGTLLPVRRLPVATVRVRIAGLPHKTGYVDVYRCAAQYGAIEDVTIHGTSGEAIVYMYFAGDSQCGAERFPSSVTVAPHCARLQAPDGTARTGRGWGQHLAGQRRDASLTL